MITFLLALLTTAQAGTFTSGVHAGLGPFDQNEAGRIVRKFGKNALCTDTEEDIWGGDGLYPGWLTAADEVRIKAGGNAADTAAGAGAREVTVLCMLADLTYTELTFATAGASASALSTEQCFRVARAYVSSTGTYGGNNTGAITIETEAGTTLIAIPAGEGQTQTTTYTVEAGYKAYLMSNTMSIDGTKAAEIHMWQRQNANDVTAPYSAKRIVIDHYGATGITEETHSGFAGPFAAGTDLWWSCIGPSAGTELSVHYELWLVPTPP